MNYLNEEYCDVFVQQETQDYNGGISGSSETLDKNFETLQSFFKLKPQIAH